MHCNGLFQEQISLAAPVKKVKPVVKMPSLKFLASVLHSFCQSLQKKMKTHLEAFQTLPQIEYFLLPLVKLVLLESKI